MAATTATSLAETQSNVSVSQKTESKKDDNLVASSSKQTKSSDEISSSKNPDSRINDAKDSNDTGWNTVKSKSEKYENRLNNHGQTNDNTDRHRNFQRRRPPFRGYPRNMNRTKEQIRSSGNTNKELGTNNSEVNGAVADSQSSGESADSDAKKSDTDSKSKPEYVAAPMPKTNAWGKTNSQVSDKLETSSSIANPAKQRRNPGADEKSSPAIKTQSLPAKTAWVKPGNKTDADGLKDDHKTNKVEETSSGSLL